MNIKIKLDRDELKGFVSICRTLMCEVYSGEATNKTNVTHTIYREELQKTTGNMTSKLIIPSKIYHIKLSDLMIVALFNLYNADLFQPFERVIYSKILYVIDRKHQDHIQMLMNFLNESMITPELDANTQKQLTY